MIGDFVGLKWSQWLKIIGMGIGLCLAAYLLGLIFH
jgi:hypothetical protein